MFTDHFAVAQFKEVVKEYGVWTVVETGTWEGANILKIAEIVPIAISIEIIGYCFHRAKENLIAAGYGIIREVEGSVLLTKGECRVTLHQGDSPEVIEKIIEYLKEPILFLLDAHWLPYWPLHDEIRAIKPRPNSLIVIHDAKVPGKDFNYDTYHGVECSYENFKDDLAYVNPNYKIFYNEEASASYRGILYAVPPRG